MLVGLSGCDALEAKRLAAEAEAARAKASEIQALYNGRAAETEAETAQIIARQQAEEEERESRLAAEVQRSLLRQAELDRQAARRANDMALLTIIGAPLALAGAVAGVVVFLAWRKRRVARRVQLYHQICRLQRQRRLRPGFDQSDVDAILSGVVPMEWYIVAPAEVAGLPGGERC